MQQTFSKKSGRFLEKSGRVIEKSGHFIEKSGTDVLVPGPVPDDGGSQQEDASGDQGARGPRPDDSRRYRAAHWPAVGKMTPPAIGARRAPARTTVAGTERPTGRQSAR